MKFVSAGLALAFALAPAAHAQITCDDVGRLNGAVLDDFGSLAGDEVDDDIFKTSVVMAGAETCGIDLFFEAVHSCWWRFSSEQEAVAAYNASVATLANCLPGWARHCAEEGATPATGVRNIAETHFAGDGEYTDVEWQLVVEQGTDSAYRLWVELIYF